VRGGFEGGVAFVVAEVVEGEVAGAAEEPGAWVFDFVPMGVQAQEGILDKVFRRFLLAGETVSKAEKR